MKARKTLAKSLSYVGSALSIGQNIKGAELTPQLLREAGLFEALKNKHGVDVFDYNDITLTR